MADGYLTTHVLDTARGRPAEGIAVELYRLDGDTRHFLGRTVTNADGRTNGPILPKEAFYPGTYELVFRAGAYLRQTDRTGGEPLFLDEVPVRFSMSDPDSHYHVPLLLSPFGYSTYRGS